MKRVNFFKKYLYISTILFFSVFFLINCSEGGSKNSEEPEELYEELYEFSWTHPADLTDHINISGTLITNLQLAMNNMGDAIVTWVQSDGVNLQIFMSEFRDDTWTYPAALSDNISPNGQDTYSPVVAMDDNGNAIVVWVQSDGANDQIYKSEYRNGEWTFPEDINDNISPNGQDAGSPVVAMDDNGNAIIVWMQNTGSNIHIFMSEFRNGEWTFPENLTNDYYFSPDGYDVSGPQVAMDNNGNAIIVWKQDKHIFMSTYIKGNWKSEWTHPLNYDDSIGFDTVASNPQVAMSDNGTAFIVWAQSDGSYLQIFISKFSNGEWIHPQNPSDNISPDGQDAYFPQVAMDNNGNAIIVWRNKIGSTYQLFKSEYRNGEWTHPDSLSDNIFFSEPPKVVMDDNNNAIIPWFKNDGTNDQIYKSEFRNGVWVHPTDINDNISPDGQDARYPYAAMSNSGNAIIVWKQNDGTNNQIFMSEYR